MPGLQSFAERETALLAPYAMRSVDSAGRKHTEPDHPYRSPFQRDRDRILHCSAYRRLSGKMQVFTGDMGDYHRTRLTHTHEVASIARTVARALRLNEDLVEALALFHDIGHPPFGHAGEDALNECLTDDGGFSHNQHALTIAEELEIRYAGFPGLNLTAEVLDGQGIRADKENVELQPLLEVQLVDAADSITYDAHDTDDAVKLGLLTLDELAEVPLVAATILRVKKRLTNLPAELLRPTVVHELIDLQVSDVFRHCGQLLGQSGIQSVQEARLASFRIGPSAELAEQKAELEGFLYERVYRHPNLIQVRTVAQARLHEMFTHLLEHPEWLPKTFQRRSERVGLRCSVGEYIAGMTDRYCNEQYEALFRG
ncbi:MAG: metal-dependent phosphohydrolase [Planctomycetaceae bacterium]|nr:metal-dependent phosphohydrolase [Planctomycetaceae bacterium]